MLRVLSCFFLMKLRMKRCVDAKGEYIKEEKNKLTFFSSIKLLYVTWGHITEISSFALITSFFLRDANERNTR